MTGRQPANRFCLPASMVLDIEALHLCHTARTLSRSPRSNVSQPTVHGTNVSRFNQATQTNSDSKCLPIREYARVPDKKASALLRWHLGMPTI